MHYSCCPCQLTRKLWQSHLYHWSCRTVKQTHQNLQGRKHADWTNTHTTHHSHGSWIIAAQVSSSIFVGNTMVTTVKVHREARFHVFSSKWLLVLDALSKWKVPVGNLAVSWLLLTEVICIGSLQIDSLQELPSSKQTISKTTFYILVVEIYTKGGRKRKAIILETTVTV